MSCLYVVDTCLFLLFVFETLSMIVHGTLAVEFVEDFESQNMPKPFCGS